jgi:hypothetical protein
LIAYYAGTYWYVLTEAIMHYEGRQYVGMEMCQYHADQNQQDVNTLGNIMEWGKTYYCHKWDFDQWDELQEEHSPVENFIYYQENWDFRRFTAEHRALTLVYFGFTTLSTVGFGDYYPVSNSERLFGALGMLAGVAIFSYCAGELLVMVDTLLTMFNDNMEDSDDLEMFFSSL